MAVERIALLSDQLQAAIARLEDYRVPGQTLSYWASTGLLTPSIQYTGIRRSPRVYSLDDLRRARVVVSLRKRGVSLQAIRVVLGYLERNTPSALRRKGKTAVTVDVVTGKTVARRAGSPDVELPSGQLTLNLADVEERNEDVARAVGGTVA